MKRAWCGIPAERKAERNSLIMIAMARDGVEMLEAVRTKQNSDCTCLSM